jgi:superfamily II DNA or RNA helicase
MATRISTGDIARLVGPDAFIRGQAYAENGHVVSCDWFAGTRLFGSVKGTRPTTYAVSVNFKASGSNTHVSGVCTCPMSRNCKHVAALLIASQSVTGSGVDFETDTGSGVRPAKAPRVPTWRRTLSPLIAKQSKPVPTGTPLALQFSLVSTSSHQFTASNSRRAPRLGVRPVSMGKKGKWVRGSLNWNNLAYSRNFDEDHRRVIMSLHELSSVEQSFYSYSPDQWVFLDEFNHRAFWTLLDDAREAGIALILDNPQQTLVVVSSTPASLTLDIRTVKSSLVLSPTFASGENSRDEPGHSAAADPNSAEPVDADPVSTDLIQNLGYIGDPAHGIYTWSAADSSDNLARLTLTPLATPLSKELRKQLPLGKQIKVPRADRESFLTDFYPYLRDRIAVSSHDGSFEPPTTPRAKLSLSIFGQADARIEVRWGWSYLAGASAPDSAPVYRHTLWPSADERNYRDEPTEAAILTRIVAVLSGHPALPILTHQHGLSATRRLSEHASLSGAEMIEFITSTVPRLAASDDVIVHFADDMPDYREAAEAPLITAATTQRADDHDWFDLAVTVSVDGQEIPFDSLFLALATDQELMVLPDGIWFSLDRPELQQSRRLIEEARGLQDIASESLRLNRYQTDLWDELQELGVVTAQASAWRDAVSTLADTAQLANRPLPAALQATLRGYQQSGFDWLSYLYDHGLGGILADDMGLGKTLQTIALIAYAREQRPDSEHRPFLVVAPTSVVSNWASECRRFAPDLKVVMITETATRRGVDIDEIAGQADVVITSYTLFRLEFDDYNAQQWAGLLLDEAQFVKNHQSRAYQCARRLKTPFKLAITGTPMENNLMELWSLLSITAPGLFPYPTRFADYYQKPIEGGADADRLAQLRRRIRPFMLRRTKEKVAGDLPAKQEQVLELELHPKHRRVYETHLQRERQKVLGLIDDMNANRFEIFRSLTMLRQLSLDASLYDDKYAAVPSTKLDALLELLDDIVAEGHRTLIFSQFTGYLSKARDRLNAAGISYSYLDGKTRNRAKVIDDFKSGSTSVFLISLKAGGFGLNLTEADYCILLDPWWNPATESQAVDRMHRIGQTRKVMVYRLVSKDTIEEKVMALKASKSRLFESVLSEGAAVGSALSASDIRELLA